MKKRHTPEQIVRKLRQANEEIALGVSIPEVARELGISEATGFWFGIAPLPTGAGARSAVPRHNEIKPSTARAICR